MPQPMDDEAFQEVRTPEKRAVQRRRPADDDVIAAAGSGMLAVDHEFVGAEPREPRFLVDCLGRGDALAPARRGMDVDLDHARIRRDANDVHARIGRGRVALDLHRQANLFGGRLGGGDELEIVLQPLDRRQEDAEMSVARLDRHRGADRPVDIAEPLLDPFLLARFRCGERSDPLERVPANS